MKKRAQVAGMPGNEYTDIWGYVAPDGKEYAIIGSTLAVNIFDVTNCGNPILKYQFLDGLDSTNYWRDFKTYQNFVYGVADTGEEGLQIFNLTQINNINVTQSTAQFKRAHNIYIDVPNARLYVAGARDNTTTTNWMIIYSLSNPASPTLLKKVALNTLPGVSGAENLYMHDVYVENHIAYVSQGYAGFYIWDCTDPNNITFKGYLDDGSNYNHSSWRHTAYNNPDTAYFYVAEEVPIGRPIKVIRTLKNSTGYDINLLSTFKHPLGAPTYTNNRPHNPFVKENGLYIAYYHDGIQVYDVSNPIKPIRAAYYDTYPNNNGNPYTSYEGAWGVYPFLPSGCILASDITYGLITLNPHFPKVLFQAPLHISGAGKGIVFKDSISGYKKLTVENDGRIKITATTTAEATNRIDSADIELVNPGKLILTSPNDTKYHITISSAGTFQTQALPVPTMAITMPGNILIDNKHKGLIFETANGSRWKTTVSTQGISQVNKTQF
ncbi:MAG: choice-of-anchor B family protein [Saprospiraceae bacterium]|nr:choice-of-anchor B family protein [Saprospiraceae bacterium]